MATNSSTLSAAGPRIKVCESEAKRILTKWQATLAANNASNPPVAITTLDISCRAWPLPTLEVLEPALVQIAPTVTTLKIDDIIASLPTDDGFATLAFFNRVFNPAMAPNITEIDLSDNALGTRSLNHIPDLLERSPKLNHLSLHNCGMSKEVARQLSEKLGSTIAPQLKSLRLGRNQMGKEGASSFGELFQLTTSLECLSYAGSRPLSEGTMDLCKGLVALAEAGEDGKTKLVELDLDDCNFGTGENEEEDALLPLCTVLRASPNLKKLVVKDGGLEQDGFEILVDAVVESGAKLSYLDIGALDLEEDGAEALANFIKDHLSDSLEELHAETNSFEDGGLQKLLPVLVNCPKLKVLNITENLLEADGFAAISTTKIPTLEKLVMKENMEEDIDEEVVKNIRGLYPTVLIADDDEEVTEEEPTPATEDTQVDDLAEALGAAQI